MSGATRTAIGWVEQGFVPDALVRAGIRRLCEHRLEEIAANDSETASRNIESFVQEMDASGIAFLPERANEQHYELPPEFFALVLGPHRKYSSAFCGRTTGNLADAEGAALEVTCERAGLADGQAILELGCGWGSLTLLMAARFPQSRITAVSNSHSQRIWIESEAARRELGNVVVVTADMNDFLTPARFDRIVSVEMFEHMRNWRLLFGRIHEWLLPGGRFFMHVFCHRSTPYAFEDRGAGDWMGREFFSGGMMPSDELALRFQDRLRLLDRWRWDGRHYEKTANAWLANLDAKRDTALAVLAAVYGDAQAEQWFQRWRIFFMACAELFGFRSGQEWWVSHYLFERSARPAP